MTAVLVLALFVAFEVFFGDGARSNRHALSNAAPYVLVLALAFAAYWLIWIVLVNAS